MSAWLGLIGPDGEINTPRQRWDQANMITAREC